MRSTAALGIALLAVPFLPVQAYGATALTITLQVDSGTPVSITDSNDLTDDLNGGDGTIDFSTTVDGIVQADGRVEQLNGPLRRDIALSSRVPGGDGVFRNLDASGP